MALFRMPIANMWMWTLRCVDSLNYKHQDVIGKNSVVDWEKSPK